MLVNKVMNDPVNFNRNTVQRLTLFFLAFDWPSPSLIPIQWIGIKLGKHYSMLVYKAMDDLIYFLQKYCSAL